MPPEDVERAEASRRSAEQFLINLRKKREKREGKVSEARQEAMWMMSLHA